MQAHIRHANARVQRSPNSLSSIQNLGPDCSCAKNWHAARAVDPHPFFADPDPAVLLNADQDPAA